MGKTFVFAFLAVCAFFGRADTCTHVVVTPASELSAEGDGTAATPWLRLRVAADGWFADVGAVGAPALPRTTVVFAVPDRTRFSGVTARATWTVRAENVKIAPVAEPTRVGDAAAEPTPDAAIYGGGTWPAEPVAAGEEQILNGVRLVSVAVTPWRWNPQTGLLEEAPSVAVTVTFEDDATARSYPLVAGLADEVRELVANPDAVASVDAAARRVSLLSAAPQPLSAAPQPLSAAPSRADYLLLSPPDFVADWQWYVRERKVDHPDVTFLVTNTFDIYAAYPYSPTNACRNAAESIHAFLRDNRTAIGFRYVVLGGAWLDAQNRKKTEPHFYGGELMSLSNCVPGVYGYPREDWREIPSDMFYACLDMKNGQKYPWDANENGIYIDQNDCSKNDLMPDVVVTRITLNPYRPNGWTAYNRHELVTNYVAKLRRGEAKDFQGHFRYGLSPDSTGSRRSRVNAERMYYEELEFYDNMYNMFDPRHSTWIEDNEVEPRRRIKDQFAKWRPVLEAKGMMNFTWTKGFDNLSAAIDDYYASNRDYGFVYSHGWAQGATHFQAYRFATGKGLTLLNGSNGPCDTGYVDYHVNMNGVATLQYNLGDSGVSNPEGGALVSINNTRWGWAGGSHTGLDFDSSMSYFMLNRSLVGFNQLYKDAGHAWLKGVRDYASFSFTQGGGTHTWTLTEQICYGDPLVRLPAPEDRWWKGGASGVWDLSAGNWSNRVDAVETYYSASNVFFEAAAATTVTVADTVGMLRLDLSASQPQSADPLPLFTFLGAPGGQLRVMKRLDVTGGDLRLAAAGGVGHDGIAFARAGGQSRDGELTFAGTNAFYVARVAGAARVNLLGGGVTLDADLFPSPAAPLVFAGPGKDQLAIPNELRSRKAGGLRRFGGLALTNTWVKLATADAFGRTEAPVTNTLVGSTLEIAANAFYEWKGCWKANGYAENLNAVFDVGGNSSVRTSEGGLWTVSKTTVFNLEKGAQLTLAASSADCGGKVVINGAGETVLEVPMSDALSGEVTVGKGVRLVLDALPLENVNALTLEDGAELVLPHARSGYWQILPVSGKLACADGVAVYDAADREHALVGTPSRAGSFFREGALYAWTLPSGDWDDKVARAADKILFDEVAGGTAAVRVTTQVAPSFAFFANAATRYSFTGTDAATVTFNGVVLNGDTAFDLPVIAREYVELAAGTSRFSRVIAPYVSVAEGATLVLAGSHWTEFRLSDGAVLKAVDDASLDWNLDTTFVLDDAATVVLDLDGLTLTAEPKVILAGEGHAWTQEDFGRFVLSRADAELRLVDGHLAVVRGDGFKSPYARTCAGGAANWNTSAWTANGKPFTKAWGDATLDVSATIALVATNADATLVQDCAVEASVLTVTTASNNCFTLTRSGTPGFAVATVDLSDVQGEAVLDLPTDAAAIWGPTNAEARAVLNCAATGVLTMQGGAVRLERPGGVLLAAGAQGILEVRLADLVAPTRIARLADGFEYPNGGFEVSVLKSDGTVRTDCSVAKVGDELILTPPALTAVAPSGTNDFAALVWRDADGKVAAVDDWTKVAACIVTGATDSVVTSATSFATLPAQVTVVGTLTLDLSSLDGAALAKNAVAGAPYSHWILRSALPAGLQAGALPAMPDGYSAEVVRHATQGLRLVVKADASVRRGSFGVNFSGGRSNTADVPESRVADQAGVSNECHGAHAVLGAYWNDCPAANGTYTRTKVVGRDGVCAATGSVKIVLSNVANPYTTGYANTKRILYGYLDDSKSPLVTLSGIPFKRYRIIAYRGTDHANNVFSTVWMGASTTDMKAYYGPSAGNGTGGYTLSGDANVAWGDTDFRSVLAEGVNYVVSDVLEGPTAVVYSPKHAGRACLAALQVVEVPAADDWVAPPVEPETALVLHATAPAGETRWSKLVWCDAEETVVSDPDWTEVEVADLRTAAADASVVFDRAAFAGALVLTNGATLVVHAIPAFTLQTNACGAIRYVYTSEPTAGTTLVKTADGFADDGTRFTVSFADRFGGSSSAHASVAWRTGGYYVLVQNFDMPTYSFTFDGSTYKTLTSTIGLIGGTEDAKYFTESRDGGALTGCTPYFKNAWSVPSDAVWSLNVVARMPGVTGGTVFCMGRGGYCKRGIVLAASGKDKVAVYANNAGASSKLVEAEVAFSTRQFHSYAIVSDGKTVTFYVDGVAKGTAAAAGYPEDGHAQFFTLHSSGVSGLTGGSTGAIDDWRLFSGTALTPESVRGIAEEFAPWPECRTALVSKEGEDLATLDWGEGDAAMPLILRGNGGSLVATNAVAFAVPLQSEGEALTVALGTEGLLLLEEGLTVKNALTLDLAALDGTNLAANAVAGAPYSRWLVRGTVDGTVAVENVPTVPQGYAIRVETLANYGIRLVVTAPKIVKYGSVSVNFAGGRDQKTNDAGSRISDQDSRKNLPHGAHAVVGTAWNDLPAANATNTVAKGCDAAGECVSDYCVTVATTQVNNPYTTGVDEGDRILYGYIDDGQNPRVELSGIPFAKYRLIVYRATDEGGTTFSCLRAGPAADRLTYCHGPTANDSTGGYTVLDSVERAWGDTDVRATLAEGVNYLVTDVFTNSTAVLLSPRHAGRAGVAAIQIVEVGRTMEIAAVDYRADLTATTAWADGQGPGLEGHGKWQNDTVSTITVTARTDGAALDFDTATTAEVLRVVSASGIATALSSSTDALEIAEIDLTAAEGAVSLADTLGATRVVAGADTRFAGARGSESFVVNAGAKLTLAADLGWSDRDSIAKGGWVCFDGNRAFAAPPVTITGAIVSYATATVTRTSTDEYSVLRVRPDDAVTYDANGKTLYNPLEVTGGELVLRNANDSNVLYFGSKAGAPTPHSTIVVSGGKLTVKVANGTGTDNKHCGLLVGTTSNTTATPDLRVTGGEMNLDGGRLTLWEKSTLAVSGGRLVAQGLWKGGGGYSSATLDGAGVLELGAGGIGKSGGGTMAVILRGGTLKATATCAVALSVAASGSTRLVAAHGETLTLAAGATGTGTLLCGGTGDGDGTVVLKGGYATVTLGGAFTLALTEAQAASKAKMKLFKAHGDLVLSDVTLTDASGAAVTEGEVKKDDDGYAYWYPPSALTVNGRRVPTADLFAHACSTSAVTYAGTVELRDGKVHFEDGVSVTIPGWYSVTLPEDGGVGLALNSSAMPDPESSETDTNGYFHVTLPAAYSNLWYRLIGYETLEDAVKADGEVPSDAKRGAWTRGERRLSCPKPAADRGFFRIHATDAP